MDRVRLLRSEVFDGGEALGDPGSRIEKGCCFTEVVEVEGDDIATKLAQSLDGKPIQPFAFAIAVKFEGFGGNTDAQTAWKRFVNARAWPSARSSRRRDRGWASARSST